jgi:general secretion pathway protein I
MIPPRRFGAAAGDAGFTLLEVMIAFVIAGLAVMALLRAGSVALDATRTATRYEEALSRAQSHLDAAIHGSVLRPEDTNGDDGGGFHWRLRVVRADATALPPMGLIRRTALPVTLYAVTVWIFWKDGDTGRDVRLDTEQIGPAGT